MFDIQSRREFIRRAILAGTATAAMPLATSAAGDETPSGSSSPNEKLNIAVVGCANRGYADLKGVSSESIVALCDIDESHLAKAASEFPAARKYVDYRRMIDDGGFDALVVGTPDHSHAIPVVRGLEAGLDIYCEKPLAHSVWEVRQMREWAARKKAVTQMGTQIHAGNNYRRVVELVKAGTIGPIQRVHVWHGGTVRPGKRVAKGTPPKGVDYDLWIGPAPMRPFDLSHFHFNWRYWWDFGGGTLGDFGCHYMDLPFWALDLRYPTRVAATGEKAHEGDNEVPGNMKVDYQFPARGDQPPVHLTWYHGAWHPEGAEQYGKGSAVLFEGAHGRLLADYGTHKLYQSDDDKPMDVKAIDPIPNSIGHHAEWIAACKSRGPTTCNFDYSGALAEAVLLGNVSYRADQKPLEWDAVNLVATNCPEAEPLVRREYRKGWSLE